MSEAVTNNEDKNCTKILPVRMKSSSSRSKMLSNIELFCWQCQSVTKLSQSESGIPVPCSNCGEYMITPRGRLEPNIVVGDFVIKKRLGAGGAGTVFLAYQRSLDRLCALKVLHDSINDNSELLKEARIAAKLNHPNIIQCYAVTTEASLSYYAMEYVAGRTVRQILAKNWKLAPANALNIAIQVCEALCHAWKESRLVHRDIKPDNIMVSEDGDVKVADFGLARLTGESYETENNVFRGTPKYACPEIIRQDDVDFRGDMYSLGVVLYKMLTGNTPFNSTDRLKMLKMHLSDVPASPSTHTPDLPKELDFLVLRLLEKHPEKRFASYDALIQALRNIRQELSSLSMTETTLFLEKLDFDYDDTVKISPKSRTLATRPQKDAVLEIKKSPFSRKLGLMVGGVVAIFAAGIFLYLNATADDGVVDYSKLTISSVLPDPMGYDLGHETFTIKNIGKVDIDLKGVTVADNSARKMPLNGVVKAGSTLDIKLDSKLIQLDNLGDELTIYDPTLGPIQKVTFTESMIKQGKPLKY